MASWVTRPSGATRLLVITHQAQVDALIQCTLIDRLLLVADNESQGVEPAVVKEFDPLLLKAFSQN